MRLIKRAIRAEQMGTLFVTGKQIDKTKLVTREMRQSKVIVSIGAGGQHAAVCLKRTRARELRDALNRILGDA